MIFRDRPRGQLERRGAVDQRLAALADIELRVRDREVTGPQQACAVADRDRVLAELARLDELRRLGLDQLGDHGLLLPAELLAEDLRALRDRRLLAGVIGEAFRDRQ